MQIHLSPADDKSTYVVHFEFNNENGVSMVPESLSWSLRDRYGNVINGRENVIIVSPASFGDIVLSGNDLAYADGKKRFLTIIGTYSSDLGSNLPFTAEAVFTVTNFIGVP